MRNVRQLASMLHELDDMLVSCMRCGICQSVCPIYGATMREADVARGKIALLENLANSMIADAEGVNAKLNRCLLCGSCQKNCPSGVNSLDIFLRARGIVTGYMGLSPVKKIIFRGLLVRPGLFNIFLEISGKFQGLFLKDANTTLGTSCSSLLRPVVGDRHFPALAKEPFHAQLSSLDTPAGASGLRIAFFPGCVSDKLFPNVPAAMLTVMQKHEVGVYMPPDQGCCGIPALASGDRKTYDALVRRNVELFCAGSFDYLITPCATCAATIKEIWPKLLEGHSEKIREKIGLLQKKTIDVSAFLVDVLKVPLPASSREGKRITYHDACHLKKSLGVSEQPRVLLNGLPGWQLVEMPEADRCCGCGGSFSLFHYDLSSQIGQRKRDNIVSVRPDAVATGCPACMMQIMDMLSHNNDHIPVKHVIELYAETL
ncbi:MAG: (Fe-S)-binding protein [Desulfovibrio sp.]|nr:(Fe-S)-binding protein [Desulfovibrio sp.]